MKEVSIFFCSEQVHLTAQKDLQSSVEMQNALESQLEAHREQHQKQISNLRDEVASKQAHMDQLKE